MAKFIKEYTINVGDTVEFRVPAILPTDPHYTKNFIGIVKDVSKLPIIKVEVNNSASAYKDAIWTTSIMMVNNIIGNENWIMNRVEF